MLCSIQIDMHIQTELISNEHVANRCVLQTDAVRASVDWTLNIGHGASGDGEQRPHEKELVRYGRHQDLVFRCHKVMSDHCQEMSRELENWLETHQDAAQSTQAHMQREGSEPRPLRHKQHDSTGFLVHGRQSSFCLQDLCPFPTRIVATRERELTELGGARSPSSAQDLDKPLKGWVLYQAVNRQRLVHV